MNIIQENEKTSQELLNLAISKFFDKTEQSQVRICPVCNLTMRKYTVDYSDLEIDICDKCGGKFLDNGEFRKVYDFKKVSTLLS